MQAVQARGPKEEDLENTRRSQEYWAKYRFEQAKRDPDAGDVETLTNDIERLWGRQAPRPCDCR
jgi:hypothetical protein